MTEYERLKLGYRKLKAERNDTLDFINSRAVLPRELQRLRKSQGYKIVDVIRLAGITRSSIINIESGGDTPMKNLRAYCNLLQIDITYVKRRIN